MLKKAFLIGVAVSVFLISSIVAFAHQPRLVWETNTSKENPIVIETPEISQAFYGELKGEHDFYVINADEPFSLYLNVLIPEIDEVSADISVKVTKGNEVVYYLDGIDAEWTSFYEEFAGDNYLKGPEARLDAAKGTYDVEVISLDNEGKYVLAVGEEERFGLPSICKTLVSLPKLKSGFFEKSAWTAYFNMIGVYLLGFVFVFVLVFVLVFGGLLYFVKVVFRRIRSSAVRSRKIVVSAKIPTRKVVSKKAVVSKKVSKKK